MKFSDFIDVRDGTHESPKATDKGKKLITTKIYLQTKLTFQMQKIFLLMILTILMKEAMLKNMIFYYL